MGSGLGSMSKLTNRMGGMGTGGVVLQVDEWVAGGCCREKGDRKRRSKEPFWQY